MAPSANRLCFVLAFLAAACGSDSSKGSSQGGAGGALAAGGAVGSGGSPAAGGGVATSGGASSAGGASASSGGAIASGGANTAGAGGATDAGTPLEDGSAPAGSCRTNADCATTAGKLLCEAATGTCIACHTNAQCSAKQECVNEVCVELPKCQNSLDCASAPGGKTICDQPNGVCVQCTTKADCGAGKDCNARLCRTTCGSDNDCSAQHLLCNKGIGFNGQCTECIAAADCDSGEYCEAGSCVSRTCKPAQQSCDGDLIVQCNETGSGVTPLSQCTLVLLSSCIEDADNARCVGGCENGKKDGLETDVDCGGPACQRCSAAKACVLLTDCSSNKCTSSKCE